MEYRNALKKTIIFLTRRVGLEGYLYQYVRFRGGQKFDEATLIYKLFLGKDEPGCMIDVGAHFGESALPYLTRGWKVHSFEPDIAAVKIKALTDIADSYINFRYCKDVISDEDGVEVSFYSSDESTGISSIIPFTKGHKEINKLRTKKLSTFLNQNPEIGIEIDYLKIDTEGNDLNVLKGFPFESIKPDVIMCEFEDAKTLKVGYRFQDMGDFLLSKGYNVYLSEWYQIEKYGVKHKWRSIRGYPCNLEDEKGWGNFIAVTNDYKECLERLI